MKISYLLGFFWGVVNIVYGESDILKILRSQPDINRAQIAPEKLLKIRLTGSNYTCDVNGMLSLVLTSKTFRTYVDIASLNSSVSWTDQVLTNDGKTLIVERKLGNLQTAISVFRSKRNDLLLPLEEILELREKELAKWREKVTNYVIVISNNDGTVSKTYGGPPPPTFQETLAKYVKINQDQWKELPPNDFPPDLKKYIEEEKKLREELAYKKIRITFEVGKGIVRIEPVEENGSLSYKPGTQIETDLYKLITSMDFLLAQSIAPPTERYPRNFWEWLFRRPKGERLASYWQVRPNFNPFSLKTMDGSLNDFVISLRKISPQSVGKYPLLADAAEIFNNDGRLDFAALDPTRESNLIYFIGHHPEDKKKNVEIRVSPKEIALIYMRDPIRFKFFAVVGYVAKKESWTGVFKDTTFIGGGMAQITVEESCY